MRQDPAPAALSKAIEAISSPSSKPTPTSTKAAVRSGAAGVRLTDTFTGHRREDQWLQTCYDFRHRVGGPAQVQLEPLEFREYAKPCFVHTGLDYRNERFAVSTREPDLLLDVC